MSNIKKTFIDKKISKSELENKNNYFEIFKDLDCRRAWGGRADRPKTLEN